MTGQTPIKKKLLHYTKKAMNDYRMINTGDRVMVYRAVKILILLKLLNLIRTEGNYEFDIFAFILDQSQPGWNDSALMKPFYRRLF